MTELWGSLIPLAIASAILPVQITITFLLLRAPGGRATALAWVGGMTLVRLAQWLVFGVILERAVDDGEPGTSAVEGALLLVVAVVFLVSAARKLAKQPDEDAPPPRWMTAASGVPPGRGFLMGAGVVGLSAKLWAFTLAAIGAIADAGLGAAGGLAVFVVFTLIAEAIHLAAIGFAFVAPARTQVVLGSAIGALERHSRTLMVGLGLVFGAWFLVRSLTAFGIL
jgi:hypothetical protein